MRVLTWLPQDVREQLAELDPARQLATPALPSAQELLDRAAIASADAVAPALRPGSARRRWRLLAPVAAAAVVLLVVVALVTADRPSRRYPVAAPTPTTSPTTSPSPSNAGTAAQNKADAQAAADRFLRLAPLPPGAHRVTSQPAGLNGPGLGVPATSQLIDSVAYFTVLTPLSQVHAWVSAHTPVGFIGSGTASGSEPGHPAIYGFQYDPSPSPRWPWGTANLQVTLTAQSPTATAIRVDGIAQWIDPTPAPDTATGRKIRVTVSGGCPASDLGRNDVSNPDAPDLHRQLLPSGAPTEALTCSYDGLNGKQFALASSQHLNAAQAGRAAANIQALQLGRQGIEPPFHCPMEDYSVSILVFRYPDRPDIDIWQHTSGCRSTDNGYIVAGRY